MAALSAAAQAAAKINAMLAAKGKLNTSAAPPAQHSFQQPAGFGQDYSLSREIEINDVPNPQRYSLTKGLFQEEITRGCKTSISTRGRYFAPEEKEVFLKANPDLSRVPSTDRPLYLLVQASNETDLDTVVGRVTVIIQEALMRRPQAPSPVNMLPPSSRPLHYSQQKVFIGLEAEPGFDVREKVSGPGNSYLNHITAETGARLQLRGRGSGYLEPTSGREAYEQMYIHVRCGGNIKPRHGTQMGLGNAVRLCESLVQNVRQQYTDFKRAQAPPPAPYGYPGSAWYPPPPPPGVYAQPPYHPPAPYGGPPPAVPPPAYPPAGPYAYAPPAYPSAYMAQPPPPPPPVNVTDSASEPAAAPEKRRFVEGAPAAASTTDDSQAPISHSTSSLPAGSTAASEPSAQSNKRRFAETTAPAEKRPRSAEGRGALANGSPPHGDTAVFKAPSLPAKRSNPEFKAPPPPLMSKKAKAKGNTPTSAAPSALVDYGDDSDDDG